MPQTIIGGVLLGVRVLMRVKSPPRLTPESAKASNVNWKPITTQNESQFPLLARALGVPRPYSIAFETKATDCLYAGMGLRIELGLEYVGKSIVRMGWMTPKVPAQTNSERPLLAL